MLLLLLLLLKLSCAWTSAMHHKAVPDRPDMAWAIRFNESALMAFIKPK